MKAFSNNIKIVSDAISREDWEQVAGTAPKIDNHLQPLIVVSSRSFGFSGFDVGKFESYDKQTHQAAKELKDIAMRNIGKRVIDQFATLQYSYLACHQSFRENIREHFYEK